jgi:hypothetical protein
MATRGTPIPSETIRLIVGLRGMNFSLRTIARHSGVALSTVQRYLPPPGSSVQRAEQTRVGFQHGSTHGS